MKICPHCGTKLKKVRGKDYCPNHGIIDEDYEQSDEETRGYIR